MEERVKPTWISIDPHYERYRAPPWLMNFNRRHIWKAHFDGLASPRFIYERPVRSVQFPAVRYCVLESKNRVYRKNSSRCVMYARCLADARPLMRRAIMAVNGFANAAKRRLPAICSDVSQETPRRDAVRSPRFIANIRSTLSARRFRSCSSVYEATWDLFFSERASCDFWEDLVVFSLSSFFLRYFQVELFREHADVILNFESRSVIRSYEIDSREDKPFGWAFIGSVSNRH